MTSAVMHGRERIADGPGALHEAESALARWLGGPGLGDKGGTGGPLAAHAEAEQDATDRKLRNGVGERAEAGGKAVDKDAGGKRPGATEPVGDEAEEDPSGGGGQ